MVVLGAFVKSEQFTIPCYDDPVDVYAFEMIDKQGVRFRTSLFYSDNQCMVSGMVADYGLPANVYPHDYSYKVWSDDYITHAGMIDPNNGPNVLRGDYSSQIALEILRGKLNPDIAPRVVERAASDAWAYHGWQFLCSNNM